MVMDESFFADFTFAPSNQAVHSSLSPSNGQDSSSFADDDWGDFVVNSGGLAHTLSLHKLSKPLDRVNLPNDDSLEPTQPGSALSRVNSGSGRWEKPKGALPLSIFGIEEEEEENVKSGADATSFGYNSENNSADSVKNGSSLNVNDLIANLYNNKHIDPEKESTEKPLVEEINSNSKLQVTDLNGKNDAKLKLDWDPLNLNPKVKGNSNANGASTRMLEGDDDGDDDVWEFKDAQNISKINEVTAENGMPTCKVNGFDENWDSADLNFNGNNYNVNGVISSKNPLVKGPVDGNRELDDDYGGGDEWEFMGVDSKPQIKTEHTPGLNSSESRSSWDLFSGFGGVNSVNKHLNGNLIDEKKDFGGTDEWTFKVAEPELEVRDGNSKIKTESQPTLNSDWISSSWKVSSLDDSVNANSNLNKKQVNLNFFGDNDDLGGNDGWEFKTAEEASRSEERNTKGDARMTENFDGGTNMPGFDGEVFCASEGTSQKLGESNFEFDFNSVDKSKQNGSENGFCSFAIDEKIGSDVNSWAFKDAFSEIGLKDKEEVKVPDGSPSVETFIFDGTVQGNKAIVEGHKGALPLSIFGDEENETDETVIHQDFSTQMPISNLSDSVKSFHSDMSINDLITNLYGQAQQNDSFGHAEKLNQNHLDSTKMENSSVLTDDDHDLDFDSWKFQDAVTEASHTNNSIKGELCDCVQLFSKLKEELQYVTLHHFENLEKAQGAAVIAGEDTKTQALDKEMQDLTKELHQDNVFSSEVLMVNHSPRVACLNVFIEVLQEPKFHVFESEYQLMKKLSLAENDISSAIELLKDVALTLQILTSVPKDGQSNYLSAWFKMLSVCAQELRHGAFIWKQALQENVQGKVLSKPQGTKYVIALGEIYRVVEVIGSSARLYKPWILASSTGPTGMFTLLCECYSLWSNSGLEEALLDLSNSADFEDDGNLKKLLDSIKYIRDLDAHTLYNHVFSGQSPTCHLSALDVGTVPGMKTVVWNGEHCFLTLANLWVNLVSSDPPDLPCVHVGQ